MFQSKKVDSENSTHSTTSIIAKGVELKGDIFCKSDIRVDGIVKGNIKSEARVVIGSNGEVEGNISCTQSDVMGKVIGNIFSNDLISIRGTANVQGDIHAGKLQIEPTVTLNGKVIMGANVVDIKKDVHEQNTLAQ